MVNNDFIENEGSSSKSDQDSDIFNYVKLEKEKKMKRYINDICILVFHKKHHLVRIIKYRQAFKCMNVMEIHYTMFHLEH